jgi:hypothetical protein
MRDDDNVVEETTSIFMVETQLVSPAGFVAATMQEPSAFTTGYSKISLHGRIFSPRASKPSAHVPCPLTDVFPLPRAFTIPYVDPVVDTQNILYDRPVNSLSHNQMRWLP